MEIKLADCAWLESEVTGGRRGSTIRQTAIFYSISLVGLIFRYGIASVGLCGSAPQFAQVAADCEEHLTVKIIPDESVTHRTWRH